MPYQIDSQSDIYERAEVYVANEIPELTNFGPNSPEYILVDATAQLIYRHQHGILASQLSAWINFSGGPVSEDDLATLYTPEQIDRIDIPYLNSLMVDYDLDQKAAELSIERDPGSPALGEILVTVDSPDVTVETGTLVGTTPDATGEYLAYRITDSGSPTGASTTVTLPIEAWDREGSEPAVGTEYNVGSNLIEHVPDEQERDTSDILAVTNPNATQGGEGEEGNASLRRRSKRALVTRSGGGTEGGIEGQFVNEFAAIEPENVDIIQHHDGQPTLSVTGDEIDTYDPDEDPELTGTGGAPYGRALVDAPQVTDAEFETFFAQDDVFPSAVYHRLLRATRRDVDVDLTLAGTDIDTTEVQNDLTRYLSDLTLGENVTDGKVIAEVINSDAELEDADPTFGLMESHTYTSGTAQYQLDSEAASVASITGTSGGSQTTFTEGTDYTLTDSDTDGLLDTIDFSVGGASPDDGTVFTAEYEPGDDIIIGDKEVADPGTINVTVDADGGV